MVKERRELGGRGCLHSQGMNGFTGQFTSQGSVNHLVLLHPGEADKRLGNHFHLEMVTSAGEILHHDGSIRKSLLDGRSYVVRMNHGLGGELSGI
jgi:hypothetical protein